MIIHANTTHFPALAPVRPTYDVIISGGGIIGCVVALSLATLYKRILIVSPQWEEPTEISRGRSVALLQPSIAFLCSLEVWEELEPFVSHLKVLHLVDDKEYLFRSPPLRFYAQEIGYESFGANIENHHLLSVLQQRIRSHPSIEGLKESVTGSDLTESAEGEPEIEVGFLERAPYRAKLLVGAEGPHSPTRYSLQGRTLGWPYKQVALTTTLRHTLPHENVSHEFHTEEGPCTLVPLPGTSEHPHRSSLVWVMPKEKAFALTNMSDSVFIDKLEKRVHYLLGSMFLDPPQNEKNNPSSKGFFPLQIQIAEPLIGTRKVLMGEAAHILPPIGAQGLNLSLRDCEALRACLQNASDPGEKEVLQTYAAARRGDIYRRSLAVHLLNASLQSKNGLINGLRSLLWLSLTHNPALRHRLMGAFL